MGCRPGEYPIHLPPWRSPIFVGFSASQIRSPSGMNFRLIFSVLCGGADSFVLEGKLPKLGVARGELDCVGVMLGEFC